jgi:predicted component of type VI protein secretion system
MGHSTVPLVIPYNESTAVKGQNDIQHFSQLFHTITMQILLKAWHEDRFHTSLISQNNDQTAMWKQ